MVLIYNRIKMQTTASGLCWSLSTIKWPAFPEQNTTNVIQLKSRTELRSKCKADFKCYEIESSSEPSWNFIILSLRVFATYFINEYFPFFYVLFLFLVRIYTKLKQQLNMLFFSYRAIKIHKVQICQRISILCSKCFIRR